MLDTHEVCPLILIVRIIQMQAKKTVIHKVTTLDLRGRFSEVSSVSEMLVFISSFSLRTSRPCAAGWEARIRTGALPAVVCAGLLALFILISGLCIYDMNLGGIRRPLDSLTSKGDLLLEQLFIINSEDLFECCPPKRIRM